MGEGLILLQYIIYNVQFQPKNYEKHKNMSYMSGGGAVWDQPTGNRKCPERAVVLNLVARASDLLLYICSKNRRNQCLKNLKVSMTTLTKEGISVMI